MRHLHLLLNHVPVVGMGFSLALLIVALLRKNEELKRVSLWFVVVVALVAVPVFLTGEPAEKTIERLGLGGQLTEQHELAAQWAFGTLLVLGAAALAGLLRYRGGQPLPMWLIRALIALAVGTTVLLVGTAGLGGKIRHTEIRAAQH